MEEIFSTGKRYVTDDFCRPSVWNDKSKLIIYDTNNYRTCEIDHLIHNQMKRSTSLEINRAFSHHLVLKDKYKLIITKMFPSTKNSYIGGHIRTWGYFNDFKDFISKERFDNKVSTFNISKVNSTILIMVKKYIYPFFLSTESIKT